MAVPDTKGFRVKNNNETGISKIATEAILDKAVTKAKLSQPVQTEINKVANKADIDGNYETLTVGQAEQLVSTVYVEDSEPYNFRTAGGSADIGDRMYEEVVGGSIVWNQWGLDGTPEAIQSTYATMEKADGVATITLTQQASTGQFYVRSGAVADNYKNHVLLALFDAKTTSQASSSKFMFGWSAWTAYESKIVNTNVWAQVGLFAKGTDSRNSPNIYYDCDVSLSVGDTIEVKNLCLFDLTQMFGSAIADAILALEQGTAGAGVAWFRNLFPRPYYEYNAGTLMSVKAGAHNTVGFNQFDKRTAVDNKYINPSTGAEVSAVTWAHSDFIRVLPNTVYYTNADGTGAQYPITFFDADKNHVGYSKANNAGPGRFRTSPKTYYVILSTLKARTSIDDLVLNLSWDGEKDGQYEPYEKHSYPLSNIELRGIPKLDANNQLYYDGDTYASDGTMTRKYGIVDLGTLTWTSQTHATLGEYFKAPVTSLRIKRLGTYSEVVHNILTSKYVTTRRYSTVFVDKTICADGAADSVIELQLKDSAFSDGTALKSALNGVYMVYELAEPTTETADAFTNPQIIDDFGTEEYVDYAYEAGDRDVAIPVGHNSQYMNNLRAKLEMAPDSPDGDGDYIVRQSNGENSYVPYTADGRLTALEAKLPAPPSTNGTYKLTATVTDGEVTYTWTAD